MHDYEALLAEVDIESDRLKFDGLPVTANRMARLAAALRESEARRTALLDGLERWVNENRHEYVRGECSPTFIFDNLQCLLARLRAETGEPK